MANIHMLIGIGEALVSALVIAAVGKTRKDLLEDLKTGTGPREYVGYGLLLAVGVALFIAPFASSWPDGLESVAAHLGFDARTVATPSIPSPLADYHLPGMGSAVTATAIAGAVGILVVFLLSFVLARMLTPRTEMNPPQE
jgi:hypothetical protein